MNFNHEYWHLRKNDPADPTDADRFGTPPPGKSVLDIKFSFGNCLDDKNEVKAAPRPRSMSPRLSSIIRGELNAWRYCGSPPSPAGTKNPVRSGTCSTR